MHGSGGHDHCASRKNARSTPTTTPTPMPTTATRPTKDQTTHRRRRWTRWGAGCARVDMGEPPPTPSPSSR